MSILDKLEQYMPSNIAAQPVIKPVAKPKLKPVVAKPKVAAKPTSAPAPKVESIAPKFVSLNDEIVELSTVDPNLSMVMEHAAKIESIDLSPAVTSKLTQAMIDGNDDLSHAMAILG